ncbi:hypothetical protein V6N11_060485 [Hibiscus sabdariffa]|uniref:Uncharacterized protein n=1 Tax=Hibiscus sabdariffa TaxID=183260 RepID=A0ABR2QQG8_9ROSI
MRCKIAFSFSRVNSKWKKATWFIPNISSHHGQPKSLAETPAKENANAKEIDNGAISNLCIDKDNKTEQRSLRLSEILGEAHDGHIGLDNI